VTEYKVIGFDLEIAEDLPEDGNIDWTIPLGVTCVGLATNDARWWLAGDLLDVNTENERYAERIDNVARLVDELERYCQRGYYIVTWNGMGFDFRVMAQDAKDDVGLYKRICNLAWNHIDIAFQMRVEKGYMIGLDAAAKGLGVEGKTEGMSGALAPQMWRQGLEEQVRVLEYVRQDARATLDIYNALVIKRTLYWTTRAGYRTKSPWFPTFVNADGPTALLSIPYRLPTVREVTQYCQPADTSWMSFQPTPLGAYYGWTMENRP